MSESELIEIAFMTISAAERQFEFWMAVTIALVVAAYTAGERLNFYGQGNNRPAVFVSVRAVLSSLCFFGGNPAVVYAPAGTHGIEFC